MSREPTLSRSRWCPTGAGLNQAAEDRRERRNPQSTCHRGLLTTRAARLGRSGLWSLGEKRRDLWAETALELAMPRGEP